MVAPTSPWLGAPVLWVLLLDVSLHVRPVTTDKLGYISDRTNHLRSLCKIHQLLSYSEVGLNLARNKHRFLGGCIKKSYGLTLFLAPDLCTKVSAYLSVNLAEQ